MSPATPGEAGRGGPLVLVVDDNEAGRYAVAKVLRQKGFATVEAATGSEALDRARAGVDLVILDVNLPDLSGFEVCRRLKSDPRTSQVPVLHLSATFVRPADRVMGLDLGADAYLVQPVEPEELAAVVRALLRMRAAEDKLRGSEARYRALVGALAEGVLTLDAAGHVVTANDKAEELLGARAGLSIEAALGTRETRLLRDDGLPFPAADLPWAATLREGRPSSNVSLAVAREGQAAAWLLVNTRPLAASGEPGSGAVVSLLDVSDQRRVRDRLVASESRFRTLVERVPAVVYVASPGGRVEFVSPQIEALLGFSAEEWAADAGLWQRRIHDDDKERVAAAFARRPSRDAPFRCEYRLLARDGRVVSVHDEAHAVGQDAEGRTLLQGIILDVTELHAARLAAERAENRSRLFLRNFSGIAYEAEPRGGALAFLEGAVEAITGREPEEFLSGRTSWQSIVHPDDHGQYDPESRAAAVQPGSASDTEYRIVRPDGRVRWVRDVWQVVFDAAQATPRLRGVLYDVTERLDIETQLRQSQKMEAIGRLAGGIAHDFNNMLGVILGFAELARQRVPPGDPLQAYLGEIATAARRSADLTQGLLAFARRQVAAPRPLDVNGEVVSLHKMLARLIGEDVELQERLAPELWAVKIDPVQVHQILTNLVSNARDAIADVGSVVVETANVQFDQEYCDRHPEAGAAGDYVMLAVTDSGSGMDAATREKIFEPFFTTKPERQGTGLGLATVYGIVRQNGGFINVYSEPGQGTTFKVYLPRHTGVAAAQRAPAGEAPAPLPRGSETVLLVEDEPQLLQVARTALEQQGYRVLPAGSPAEALRVCERHGGPIDLLFTDVVMPRMNGRELEARVRQTHPGIRTLFMSGYTANVVAHRGILEEGVQFVSKPFTVESLARAVRDALDR